MLRKASAGALLLTVCCVPVAWGSGDYGCSQTMKLTHGSYDACNNVPFLSPANDSRVNLQLLLMDARRLTIAPISPDEEGGGALFHWYMLESTTVGGASAGDVSESDSYAVGEGSRCRSNDRGAAAFARAVESARNLPADEAVQLVSSRNALSPDCSVDRPSLWVAPANVRSPAGRRFAAYIGAADAFYAGDYDSALQGFRKLGDSNEPWLRETSRYMVARTELNSAQRHMFDQWGYPELDKVDKAGLKAAEAAFEAYLRAYPDGLYTTSAAGLLRRVYWLAQDQQRLADAYERAFAQSASPRFNATVQDLAQEMDTKLLYPYGTNSVQAPHLLAVLDLMRMRRENEGEATGISLAELQSQRERFAAVPSLHDYLLAAFEFYVANDPVRTLERLPSAMPAAPLDYLGFSRYGLRGLALEVSGRGAEAREMWLRLLSLAPQPRQREMLELALAMNYERTGEVDKVFAANSPFRDQVIRDTLLVHAAGADLLRRQAKNPGVAAAERRIALYTLLYKELTRGRYQEFLSDFALLPDPAEELQIFRWAGANAGSPYGCPSLREIASTLQRRRNDPVGLNCLGEFIRDNGLDGSWQDNPPVDELGGAPSRFDGKPYSRLDGYMRVIVDGQAAADARAYALFRAIHCFEPTGVNHCGRQDIAPSQRKQWFRKLKTTYTGSPWARSLKYYW